MSCKCLLQFKNWVERLVAKRHFFSYWCITRDWWNSLQTNTNNKFLITMLIKSWLQPYLKDYYNGYIKSYLIATKKSCDDMWGGHHWGGRIYNQLIIPKPMSTIMTASTINDTKTNLLCTKHIVETYHNKKKRK
jgi:hypothetical protein